MSGPLRARCFLCAYITIRLPYWTIFIECNLPRGAMLTDRMRIGLGGFARIAHRRLSRRPGSHFSVSSQVRAHGITSNRANGMGLPVSSQMPNFLGVW